MGLLDTLDTLDLADDVKERIRQEHEGEVSEKTTELSVLRAKARRKDVDDEIENLKKLGFSEAPGLLKFVRRVLLSDDSEPGLVLLSDQEMQLSGDAATGATNKEEISVAGAVRKLIELMPKKDEKIVLSDQILLDGSGDKPDNDDIVNGDEKTDEHRQNLAKITGQNNTRSRKRYTGAGMGGA